MTNNRAHLLPFAILVSVVAGDPVAAAPAQNPRLTALAPNTALDLGEYTCTPPEGSMGSCQNITDYSGMVYDHLHHQLLMFGGGHGGSLRSDVAVFDFGTLTWSSAYTPTSCADMNVNNIDTTNGAWLSNGQPMARHTYDMLVMLEDPPEMLMTTSGSISGETCSGPAKPAGFMQHSRITGYNPETKKWTYRNTEPAEWDSFSSAEYDPVSKTTIIFGSYGLWSYDAKTDTFPGAQYLPVDTGYANNMVYAPNTDRMYYFQWVLDAPTRVYELELDRATWKTSTLTEVLATGAPITLESGYAYDTVNHVLGGAVFDGKFSAFDPVTKSWNTVVMNTDPPGAKVGSLAFHELAYDPIDGVYIFITNYASGFHVWAYRYAGSPPPPPPPSGDDGGTSSGGGGGGSEESGCQVAHGQVGGAAASFGAFAGLALLGIARAMRRRSRS